MRIWMLRRFILKDRGLKYPELGGRLKPQLQEQNPPCMLREGARPIPPELKRPSRSKGRHLFHSSRISHSRSDIKVRIELQ
jgi:hypothetical protein